MRQFTFFFTGLVTLFSALGLNAEVNTTECIRIDGMFTGKIIWPNTILGKVTGQLKGSAHANIRKLEKNKNKANLNLEHIFVTEDHDTLHTVDKAEWLQLSESSGTYEVTTQYKITHGTGRFIAANGSFESKGKVDTNRDLVSLNYQGKICGVGASGSFNSQVPDMLPESSNLQPESENEPSKSHNNCGVGKGGRIGGGSAGLLDWCFGKGKNKP